MLILKRVLSAQACPYFPGSSAAADAASRHPTGLQQTHARSPPQGSSSCYKAGEVQALHAELSSHRRCLCAPRSFTRWMPMPQRLQELLRARIEAGMAPASMRERVGEQTDTVRG